MNKPTKKQRAFINEYLQCWNATEAAKRAGYSERSARAISSRLLTKDNIREEISRRIDERAMTADEAITRLAEQARGNVGDFMVFQEGIKQPYIDLEQAQEKLHLLKKFKRDASGKIEIELYDAQSALVTILKAHGVFVDRSEVKLEGQITAIVNWDDNNTD